MFRVRLFWYIFVIDFCLRLLFRATLRRSLALTACCLYVFLLETQKEPKRSPLLPIARVWRLPAADSSTPGYGLAKV